MTSAALLLLQCHPSALYTHTLTFCCMNIVPCAGWVLSPSWDAQPLGLPLPQRKLSPIYWVEPLQDHTQMPQPTFLQLFNSRSCQRSPKENHIQNLSILSPHPWLCWHLPSNTSLNFSLCTQPSPSMGLPLIPMSQALGVLCSEERTALHTQLMFSLQ